MKRHRNPPVAPAPKDIEAALATMSADDLRELLRDILLELDERAYGRVINSVLNRATRSGSGWRPAALSDAKVAETLAFAKAAERVGQADPSDVDAHLQRGNAAFLRKDYDAVHQIFGALLRPIGDGEIDLGQHEMVDEVLGTDLQECAARYVLSAYMQSPPARRAAAVRAAIDEVGGVGHFWEPLRELERAAVEAIPGLDDFLPQWRALLAGVPTVGQAGWDAEENQWLREVVRRLEGSEGLANIARESRRTDDLRAWCQSLVDGSNWKAALAAFEEAAGLATEDDHARGALLDGAALAAQELGRPDLAGKLERAWCGCPSFLRLRRWLGTAKSKAALLKRAGKALQTCPKGAHRQQALLLVLQGAFESAAKLLAAAPGLGWSGSEHPGHLLFQLFTRLLGGTHGRGSPLSIALPPHEGMGIDELEFMTADDDTARLSTPDLAQLFQMTGVDAIPHAAARRAVLAAMRKATENRLARVTEQKRRRQYVHAADLTATCVRCDRSTEAERWAAALKNEYRRFPALRAELDRALGSS